MLGPAPILDFDGTVARLQVDWAGLKQQLGIELISDLWGRPSSAWDAVTAAEVQAAQAAPAVEPVLDLLVEVESFAVLTNNSSRAVHAFFDRFPLLRTRLVATVGREELRGPKTDFAIFRAGVDRCMAATAAARGGEGVIYVGDAAYELAFAERLGLRAICVSAFGVVAHMSPVTPGPEA
jgi:phosphoglycolate phosphatase-like HAD superfamily hydrolase